MATSSSNQGSQLYPYPSHVNASSFMSIKLSSKDNYEAWGKQMWSLVFSHDMSDFITVSAKRPSKNDTNYWEWKRSDVLVLGWIFGSLSEEVMKKVASHDRAVDVWDVLRRSYTMIPPTSHNPVIRNEFDKYKPLRTAIEWGNWETAKDIFSKDKNALTAKLDENGSTALHLAVRNQNNTTFLEQLLNHIEEKNMSLLELVDNNNFTVLQEAVLFDNTYAVELLVTKEKHLLYRSRYADDLPLMSAAISGERKTFDYLYKACKQNIGLITTQDTSVRITTPGSTVRITTPARTTATDTTGPSTSTTPGSKKKEYMDPFKGDACFELFSYTIMSGYLDVAYDLLKDYKGELNKAKELIPGDTLSYLAQKPDAYPSATSYNFRQRCSGEGMGAEKYCSSVCTGKTADIENQETKRANCVAWKSYIYPVMKRIHVKFCKSLQYVSCIKKLNEEKVKHNRILTISEFICEKDGRLENTTDKQRQFEKALILAVENDIPELVEKIIREFPQSIETMKDNKYTLYELSVMNRCGKAYNVLAQNYPRDFRERINNLLNLAAKLAPQEKLNMVTGATLQMQMELQWFEEVSNFVDRHEKKNDQNIGKGSPRMVFKREHEGLRQKGEEWMKKTADSYTITAALIITIVFAAAITVPGGNNGETGKAIYKTRASFIVFIVSDAISFFTSTTSLLLFLSILTARYEHEDFLYKLPKRLIIGLVMLFMSVTTMLIAFSAALYIMSGQDNRWIVAPIAAITCLPIVSFVTLQLPLLYDLLSSTYRNRLFGKRQA